MPDILQLQLGNAAEFESVYREYHTRVYAFMWRYTHEAEVCEELVQEVFVKLWTSRKTLNPALAITTQLFQIAKTVFIDYHRRTSRRIRYINMTEHLAEDAAIAPGVRDIALLRQVSTVIDTLPPVRREVFLLGKVQGLTYPEIAKALSISPKTVEGHMSKALKFLRHRLGGLLHLGLLWLCQL
ncbi:RNA polymerase sigma factor [Chitinophaga varians]|uniref:RNA polymerase sigma factor n=1 Tax=Chitinophaga varians TaxID=2202339 RepID=UPI00165F093E|nr:RNA polymerase sigma-70 factor [Chitinophaga varians]MBC9909637.1 RNA polymerase sigma-70 factor [Chitinophaga varians]